MSVALPIILLVVAMCLVVLDVFVPTLGLMTLAAIGCFIGSLVTAFDHSATLGWSMVGAAIVGLPVVLIVAFRLFPGTRLGRHMILSEPEDAEHLHPESLRSDLLGKEGLSLSRLRPSGVAEIEGERVDVVTRGEMVENGQRIIVLDNRGNRLLVRAVDSPREESEEEELI